MGNSSRGAKAGASALGLASLLRRFDVGEPSHPLTHIVPPASLCTRALGFGLVHCRLLFVVVQGLGQGKGPGQGEGQLLCSIGRTKQCPLSL